MTTIYLVRHCESEGNACRRNQGAFDGIVTSKGMEQNRAVSRRFADIPIDRIYSSDSYRARMTARSIAEHHGLSVRLRMFFREASAGLWEDLPCGNVPRRYPQEYETWVRTPWAACIPGGDRFEVIRDRMLEGIHRVIRETGKGTAVVVTHADSLRVLLCTVAGLPRERMREIEYGDNTAVSMLTAKDEHHISVGFTADSSHLSASLQRPWHGIAGESINMAVDDCVLPRDEEKLVLLLRARANGLGEAPQVQESLVQIREELSRHPAHAAFFSLGGELKGLVALASQHPLSETHGVISALYMEDSLQKQAFDQQPLGHAFHLARRMEKPCVALPAPRNEAERILLSRFPHEPVPGHEGFFRIHIIVQGPEVPVL